MWLHLLFVLKVGQAARAELEYLSQQEMEDLWIKTFHKTLALGTHLWSYWALIRSLA